MDQAGHLPTFISVTDGKTGDVTVARTWTFPAASVVVADRAYLDFGWLHQLQQRGVTFVTRLKRNTASTCTVTTLCILCCGVYRALPERNTHGRPRITCTTTGIS